MVDEAGQDPVEVEPAADVAGDPAQRLGPMEQMGDLLGAAGAADDRAEAVGDDAGDVEVARAERAARLADDEQDAPRPGRRRGSATASSGRRSGRTASAASSPVSSSRIAGSGVAARPVAAGRELERPAEDAVAAGQIDQPVRAGDVGAGDGPRRRADRRGAPRRRRGDGRRRRGRPGRPRWSASSASSPALISRLTGRRDARGRADGARRRAGRRAARSSRSRRRWREPRRPRPGRRCAGRPTARSAAGGDAVDGAGLGRGQEALEVTEPVAPVAARVDPVVAQPAGVAPRPDRVRVHAEEPGGLGDRQGRVRWSWRDGGRHGSWRKCEVDGPSLPISQFLPIVRWSQPAQASSSRRQADVDEGRHDRRRRRSRPPRGSRTAGSPTRPGPWPELRGSPPAPAPGSARRPARPARRPATSRRPRPRMTATRRARAAHDDGARRAASTSATTISPRPPTEAGRRDQRSAAGPPSARTRIASSGSRVVRTSGRPRPADMRGSPVASRRRARRARSRARPTRPGRPAAGPGSSAAVPAGHAVGDVGRGPDRFARDDDEARVERGVVDGDRVEALADLERHALAAVLERRPSRRRAGPGAASGGRRAADARRPRSRPRRRSGRRPGRSAAGPSASAARLGDADLGRRGEQAPDAVARAVRAQDERRRRRARRDRRPGG